MAAPPAAMGVVGLLAHTQHQAFALLSEVLGASFEGLSIAARHGRRKGLLNQRTMRRLERLDIATHVVRHATSPKLLALLTDLQDELAMALPQDCPAATHLEVPVPEAGYNTLDKEADQLPLEAARLSLDVSYSQSYPEEQATSATSAAVHGDTDRLFPGQRYPDEQATLATSADDRDEDLNDDSEEQATSATPMCKLPRLPPEHSELLYRQLMARVFA